MRLLRTAFVAGFAQPLIRLGKGAPQRLLKSPALLAGYRLARGAPARTHACLPSGAANGAAGEAKPIQRPRDDAKKVVAPPVPRGDKLVLVGLGNPGPEFDNTRHNVGFSVVSEFASRNGRPAFKHDRRLKAEVAIVRNAGKTIYVVRPRTFMNNSGQAVQAVMKYYNVPLTAVMVVADDMAMELGRMRLRAKGSAGGHNGLRSIEKYVGGNQYARLKVGVGEPRGGADQWSGHVLGRFSRGDQKVLDDVMWDTMDVLEEWVREEDVVRILNAFTNKKNRTSK